MTVLSESSYLTPPRGNYMFKIRQPCSHPYPHLTSPALNFNSSLFPPQERVPPPAVLIFPAVKSGGEKPSVRLSVCQEAVASHLGLTALVKLDVHFRGFRMTLERSGFTVSNPPEQLHCSLECLVCTDMYSNLGIVRSKYNFTFCFVSVANQGLVLILLFHLVL